MAPGRRNLYWGLNGATIGILLSVHCVIYAAFAGIRAGRRFSRCPYSTRGGHVDYCNFRFLAVRFGVVAISLDIQVSYADASYGVYRIALCTVRTTGYLRTGTAYTDLHLHLIATVLLY